MSELQPTTMKDIAEHFGVSIATVSRALNGSARVSEEKRNLICEYAHANNFYPNDIAKSLRNSHKQPVKVIGVIVPEFTHYYFSTILNGIEDAASKRGYRITDLNGVSDTGDPVTTGDNIDNVNKVLAYQTGYAANSFYVYEQMYDKNGKPIEGAVVDRNGDGVISNADKYLYKQVAAPVTMGFSTRVEWKNFDLGFSLRANLGNYVFNNFEQGKRLKTTSSVWCQNAYLANRPVNTLGWDSDALESKLSDYFVQNASFLKMDNITLGYSFNRLLKSGSWKGISGRVYASCSNVFTITNYKGIDPEVYNGIDNNIYPRPITFQFGLNLTF